jgi:retron-type reverse transcriptase
MRRYGNLWREIVEFDNLLLAAQKAQKGKRFRSNVLEFNHNRELELQKLQEELDSQTYCPGNYHTFKISDPKVRLISAAPYRDRVVHHALCHIIQPVMERSLIAHTYANRQGYGTHRALQRFTTYARNSRYILQCDIKKYFPSIDREILKGLIRRKIKCDRTLWLIDLIIDCSNEQEFVLDYFPEDTLLTPVERLKGLPIGNLTSQFFANYYLNGLDHFVQERLKIPKYLRFVDDFSLFSDDFEQLQAARTAIESYLATLRLKIHPVKSQLFETKYGANFVGFRILPDRIRVRNDNLHRARRRFKHLQQAYHQGLISLDDIHKRICSWEAHLKHGNTYRLRRKAIGLLRDNFAP